jgi:aminoglycoside N3'-acetyltransferase
MQRRAFGIVALFSLVSSRVAIRVLKPRVGKIARLVAFSTALIWSDVPGWQSLISKGHESIVALFLFGDTDLHRFTRTSCRPSCLAWIARPEPGPGVYRRLIVPSHSDSTTASLTRTDIEAGLQRLGLGRGDVAEVHSSLSRFGWVEGGAPTIVDALMDVVGAEGALVMSAYPVSKPLLLTCEEKARGIQAKVRLYREDYDGPTGMGVIADEFRRRPGTVIGKGFHRVCAWGRDAERLSEGYHRLLETDGWVLLLGVGISCCSSMHQAEKVGIPSEITEYFKLPEDIQRDYPEDTYYVSYGSTPDDAWEKVRGEAERRGMIVRQKIGSAECMLFRARAVVGIYEQALRTDPYGLFGVEKAGITDA